MKTYDHIILGTGQSAGTLVSRFLSKGDTIAVIEEAQVGGSCVNYGCTPTKALVASARAIHVARRGDEFGFRSGPIVVDYAGVRQRMNRIREASRTGLEDWLEEADQVDLIRGRGIFVDQHTLQVEDRQLKGKQIYINVGCRARVPDIDGLDKVNWHDHKSLLNKPTLPKHLLIVGGGYIGVEFAQIFRRFGSEVTILERGEHIMSSEDQDVAEAMQDFLREEGIRIICGADVESVKEVSDTLHLTITNGSKQQTITGSDLLIATGRIPNSDTIRPEAAGIELDDKGYVKVDDHCRTTAEGVFAVGDVNGHGAFTHTSVNDAEIVLDQLYGGKRALSQRIPVYAVFTDPPLGRVGMSEKEALKTGKRVLMAKRAMAEISRAKEMSETRGFAKLLVEADTGLIMGAAILGAGGDEIINMFAAIMHSEIPCRHYRRAVLAHPTVSELMPFILDGLEEIS